MGPRWPWYLEPAGPDPYGFSAGVVMRRKLIWPIFIGVDGDRQVGDVGQLEGQVTVPTRINEACRVRDEDAARAGEEVLDLSPTGPDLEVVDRLHLAGVAHCGHGVPQQIPVDQAVELANARAVGVTQAAERRETNGVAPAAALDVVEIGRVPVSGSGGRLDLRETSGLASPYEQSIR